MWGSTTFAGGLPQAGTFVIVTGNMDMSVGSVALCSSAIAVYANESWRRFCPDGDPDLCGRCGYRCNQRRTGLLQAEFHAGDLGMMILLRGIALNITNGGAQTSLPSPEFKMIADSRIGGISILILVSLISCWYSSVCCENQIWSVLLRNRMQRGVGEAHRSLPLKSEDGGLYSVRNMCGFCGSLSPAVRYGNLQRNHRKRDGIRRRHGGVVMGGTSLLGDAELFPGIFIGVVLLYLDH